MVVRLPMSRTSCKCWSLLLSWICSLCQLQMIENVVMVNRYTCNLLPWLVNISCRIIPCMEPVLRVGPEGTGWHESKGMTIYGFASAERSQYNMEGYNLHQCPISSTSRSCASLCCLWRANRRRFISRKSKTRLIYSLLRLRSNTTILVTGIKV